MLTAGCVPRPELGEPAESHLAVAAAVATGAADAGLAVRAVAESTGLGWVPLLSEPFELALDPATRDGRRAVAGQAGRVEHAAPPCSDTGLRPLDERRVEAGRVRRAAAILLALVAALAVAACGDDDAGQSDAEPDKGQMILATTTSTQDSGLLDELVPAFEDESGMLSEDGRGRLR